MKPSLRGGYLPESYEEYRKLLEHGLAKYEVCVECGRPFDALRTKTPAGWRETQISGVDEECFDTLFRDCDEA